MNRKVFWNTKNVSYAADPQSEPILYASYVANNLSTSAVISTQGNIVLFPGCASAKNSSFMKSLQPICTTVVTLAPSARRSAFMTWPSPSASFQSPSLLRSTSTPEAETATSSTVPVY